MGGLAEPDWYLLRSGKPAKAEITLNDVLYKMEISTTYNMKLTKIERYQT